jgi:hypothetical protein
VTLTAYRLGRVGWTVTLVTRRYLRTLWLDRPALTKLPRERIDGAEIGTWTEQFDDGAC